MTGTGTVLFFFTIISIGLSALAGAVLFLIGFHAVPPGSTWALGIGIGAGLGMALVMVSRSSSIPTRHRVVPWWVARRYRSTTQATPT